MKWLLNVEQLRISSYFEFVSSVVFSDSHLIPPESVFVIICEAVDHNWYWKCQNECPSQSTESTQKFASKCLRWPANIHHWLVNHFTDHLYLTWHDDQLWSLWVFPTRRCQGRSIFHLWILSPAQQRTRARQTWGQRPQPGPSWGRALYKPRTSKIDSLFLSWEIVTCCSVYAKDWSPAKWRTSLKTLMILITRTNRITFPAFPIIFETLKYFRILAQDKFYSHILETLKNHG